MVDAIICAVSKQMSSFLDSADVNPSLAKFLSEQFNLLVDNYVRYPRQLGRGIEISSNDVMNIIRKKIIQNIEDLDVSSKFVDSIKDLRNI